jgi:hypothetical protein
MLLFHWNTYGIEKMIREKLINSSFSEAAGPELQTPGAGAGKL